MMFKQIRLLVLAAVVVIGIPVLLFFIDFQKILHLSSSNLCVHEKEELQKEVERLNSELGKIREKARYYRSKWGELSCRLTGFGPTGGYCIDGNIGDHYHTSDNLINNLLLLFKNCSILDMGAGLGHYKQKFEATGLVRRYDAYDGAEGVEEASKGLVNYIDLTEQIYNEISVHDWVLSLEVAEHIPQNLESIFLGNLARHALKGMVVSWAIPGQGGFGHINEIAPEIANAHIEALGFKVNHTATALMRSGLEALVFYFEKDIFVYDRVQTLPLTPGTYV